MGQRHGGVGPGAGRGGARWGGPGYGCVDRAGQDGAGQGRAMAGAEAVCGTDSCSGRGGGCG